MSDTIQARELKIDSPLSFIVRPLEAGDAVAFAELCDTDPLRFLTPQMNIELFGFQGGVIRSWGAFQPGSRALQGILLRYSNTVIIADRYGETAAAFAPLIDGELGVAGIRGTIETIQNLRGAMRRYHPTGIEKSLFLQLTQPPECPAEVLKRARRARLEDLNGLAALYANAWTMYRSRVNVASKLAETRVFVVEEPGIGSQPSEIVSCALLNMESAGAGLIGGVFTSPTARGKGYAAACTAALSLDLQDSGKLPCLYYENPVAGRVYHRLGYQEIGQWAVLYLEKPKG